jgi:hypothetical protein
MSHTLTGNAIDQIMADIIDTRIKLNGLNYSHPDYDVLEERLHDLEDDFHSEAEKELDEVFSELYDEYCSDNDILPLASYLSGSYIINPNVMPSIEPVAGTGISVSIEEFEGKDARLALAPFPTRIIVSVRGGAHKVLWQKEQ